MQDASQYNPNSAFGLLIQGPPGSGKTSLALQFPKPYVADCDNNLSGAVRRLIRNGQKPNFKYDTIDVLPDGKEVPVADRYKRLSDCLVAASKLPDTECQTIIIDGVSKLDSYIVAEVGRQNPVVDKRPRKDGEMTIQDWGQHLYMWRNFVTRMLAVPKMIIFTAHEEASDRPDLQGMLISVQGKKVQAQLAGMFSDVWRCEVKDTVKSTGREYEWSVRTMQTASYQLKNSLGLPDTFKMDWETIRKALSK